MKQKLANALSYFIENTLWLGLLVALGLSELIKHLPFVSLELAIYTSGLLFVGLGFLYLKHGNKTSAYFIFGWIANTLILNYKFDKDGKEESLRQINDSWANTSPYVWLILLFAVMVLIKDKIKTDQS